MKVANHSRIAAPLVTALLCSPAMAWSPGIYSPTMPSKDFTVDTSQRNDVLSFWHAIYQASEGYENRINWGGNLNATNHDQGQGQPSEVFVKDVERRINYFRAMAGAPSHASVNTGSKVIILSSETIQPPADTLKSTASQRSAYMVARAYMAGNEAAGASHNPPNTVLAWTPAAWNASAHSNITYGFFGPGAMNAYMMENFATSTGGSNSEVGHRRWLLFQKASDYATGDTPGLYDPTGSTNRMQWRVPTNCLYVLQRPEEMIDVAPRFVTYPNEGFFPASLNTNYWSLSHPNANFTGASIQMRNSSGSLVGTSKIAAASIQGPGDSAIVWQVTNAAATTTVQEDVTYRITVSGITGTGVPSTYQYQVTLINPDRLTSDQSLAGSAQVPSTGPANFFLTPPPFAETIEANVFSNSATTWKEDAEAATESTTIVRTTPANYDLRTPSMSGMPALNGLWSYRMTHPVRLDIMAGGVPEQRIELVREIMSSSATAKLTFNYRRGYMGQGSTMAVEYSQDGGINWATLGSPIVGTSTNTSTSAGDSTIQLWNGLLPPSDLPYQIRFRYYRSSTSYAFIYAEYPSIPSGIFIDEISAPGCTWLELKKSNSLPLTADRFTLTPETAGLVGSIPDGTTYHLRMRTKLGNRWFPYGPSKIVTATSLALAGFDGWFTYEYPNLTGGFTGNHSGDGIPNGVKYGFMLDPLTRSDSRDVVGISSGLARDGSGSLISITRAANGLRPEVSAEWSDTLAPDSWSSEDVTVSYSATEGTATATAPAGTGKRFLRWKVTAP